MAKIISVTAKDKEGNEDTWEITIPTKWSEIKNGEIEGWDLDSVFDNALAHKVVLVQNEIRKTFKTNGGGKKRAARPRLEMD